MRTVKKIKCLSCNAEFIPRTFLEEEIFYPARKGYTILRYKEYFGTNKPFEVIVKSWVTYCPSCRNIMKFAKEIAKSEKKYMANSNKVELYYIMKEFDKPCSVYSEYLDDISNELQIKINLYFKEINLNSWFDLYVRNEDQGGFVKDHFKFLVRFIAKVESYHKSQFGIEKNKDMPIKINELKLPEELKENLINLNNIRNDVVHHEYELKENDSEKIHDSYLNFIQYLMEKHITPQINEIRSETGYNFIELNDIKNEVNIYLKKIFYEKFRFDSKLFNKILISLDEMYIK